MKPFKILAAVIALAVVGTMAQPAHAEKSLRERTNRFQKKLDRYNTKYARKQKRFERNHPHPTQKDMNKLVKWDQKFARKGSRMTAKAGAMRAHLARKQARHHRHD